jgi:trk system potassium uptake protein TrkA
VRVAIAGAGNVGRSIARELLANGHKVLLIDRDPRAIKPDSVPGAEWLLADACEVDSLEEARIDRCDVAIAATGDDKANLVHSLLAKTEFAVPRTVARVNHPSNEWMFDDVWGVDVSVSTPRLMCALVEEAVTVGDLVRLFSFRGGKHQPGRDDACPPTARSSGAAWPTSTSPGTRSRGHHPRRQRRPAAERRRPRGRRRAAVRRPTRAHELELAHYLAPGVARERVTVDEDDDEDPSSTQRRDAAGAAQSSS